MTIEMRKHDDIMIFKPTGKLVGKGVSELRAALSPHIEDDAHPRVLINFEQVHQIDSSGLGILMQAYAQAKRKDGRIGIISAGKHIKNLMVLSRLAMIFDLYDSEAAAVLALSV